MVNRQFMVCSIGNSSIIEITIDVRQHREEQKKKTKDTVSIKFKSHTWQSQKRRSSETKAVNHHYVHYVTSCVKVGLDAAAEMLDY